MAVCVCVLHACVSLGVLSGSFGISLGTRSIKWTVMSVIYLVKSPFRSRTKSKLSDRNQKEKE